MEERIEDSETRREATTTARVPTTTRVDKEVENANFAADFEIVFNRPTFRIDFVFIPWAPASSVTEKNNNNFNDECLVKNLLKTEF